VSDLYVARALRDFGDGFVAVLLPVYLAALGLGPFLMATTGLAFAASSTLAVILLVAFAGTINPTFGSVSMFVPLEHAILARSAVDAVRTKMFARYSLTGALAGAIGSLAAAIPDFVATFGVSRMTALKAMFVYYALLGVMGGIVYRRIPKVSPAIKHEPAAALGPSRGIVYKLAALFSIDAFAGGFAVRSLLALWLFDKFGLSLSAAGLFFFWSGVFSAFSFPVAAWISVASA
jgi:hypothetical protein